jgi:chemotaxis protein MotB
MHKKLFVLSLGIALSMSSCLVSKKKFDDLNKRKSSLENEKADCEQNLKKKDLEIDQLNDQLKALANDTSELGKELRIAGANYASLNDSYKELFKTHKNIVTNNQAELTKLTNNLSERELKIKGLENDLAEREKRVIELEKIIARKDSAVLAIKNKLNQSLLGFKEKDITVEIKNGKVYVSLSEQLLFKSGKTDVDEKGQDALKTVATALKNDKSINILVEGHTDDVPVSKGTACINDNWDLSVLRATSITKILIDNGFPAEKIMPAGHGEFLPVAEGKTAEARRLNRRTEIIISPNLDELFNLLNK